MLKSAPSSWPGLSSSKGKKQRSLCWQSHWGAVLSPSPGGLSDLGQATWSLCSSAVPPAKSSLTDLPHLAVTPFLHFSMQELPPLSPDPSQFPLLSGQEWRLVAVKWVLLHAGGSRRQCGCQAPLLPSHLPRKGSAEGETESHASKARSLTPTSHAVADPKEALLLGEVGVRAWGHDSQTWVKVASSHPDCSMLPAPTAPAAPRTDAPCQDRPFWVIPSSGDSGLGAPVLRMRARFGQPHAVLGRTPSGDKLGRVRHLLLPPRHSGQILLHTACASETSPAA